MTDETKLNTTAPAAATKDQAPQVATLHERVLALIAEDNAALAVDEAHHREQFPDREFGGVPVTLQDVLNALSACVLPGKFNVDFFLAGQIVEAIIETVAGDSFDPWPGLTKAELQFLIGDRGGKRDCPNDLWNAVRYDEQEPLTLAQKVLAVRHRTWLEKGADKKRADRAKTEATNAALEGREA